MMRIAAVFILLGLAVPASAQSDKILLKTSFWSGWKYTTDGQAFHSVGLTGKNLRLVMEGNEEAQRELDAYKANGIGALVTGIAGGVAAGAAGFIVVSLDEGEDPGAEVWVLLGTGFGLGIASAYMQNLATNHLLKAVHLYNWGDYSLEMDISSRPSFAAMGGHATVGLTLRF